MIREKIVTPAPRADSGLLGRHLGMFKDAAPVSVNVNLPTDQSSFSERLAARRKERALAEKTQLH